MAPKKKNNIKKTRLPNVAGGNISAPFFLVTLANSLETIGVDFNYAHEIARNITEDLFKGPAADIDRTKLRRDVYTRLTRELGEEVSSRYVRFRRLTELSKPLIIFLGGSTGAGKNTVAMEIAQRLGITTVISTDVIRELMRTLISEELLPMLHTSSYLAHKKLWIPLKEGRSQETLAFREQALRVNAGLKGLIKRSIKEKTDLIINGVHILPDMLNPEDFRNANIVKVFLHVSNKEEHRKRFYIRGGTLHERPADKYLENFDTIRVIQKYIMRRAKEKGYLQINNRNSRQSAIKIITHIIEKIEKVGGNSLVEGAQ